MPVLMGVVVDLSGSTALSLGGSWIEHVSKVVDVLLKNVVVDSNDKFVIAVDATGHVSVPINTLANKGEVLEKVLTILEQNGAPTVRNWVTLNGLFSSCSYDEAVATLDRLKSDFTFRTTFVDMLPDVCKVRYNVMDGVRDLFLSSRPFENSVKSVFRERVAVAKEVGKAAVRKVNEIRDNFFGWLGNRQLSDMEIDELKQKLGFMYDGTPLMDALVRAWDLFTQYRKPHKVLLVLSNNQPTDGDYLPLTVFSTLGVGCFSIMDPLLFDLSGLFRTKNRNAMIRINSPNNDLIPRTYFVKKGWKIEMTKTETRFFLNKSDVISDFVDLIKNIGTVHDALSDILKTVSLDVYINQANISFGAKTQVEGTCYANAIAAVLHLAMNRIVERVEGYPNFFEIRKKVIDKYGWKGANISDVLKEMCPQYRLQFKPVFNDDAKKAVAAKRPIIAAFWLTDPEWDSFSAFYKHPPCGILTRSEIDILKRPRGAKLGGHAVVLTSYNSECLTFMNSWGSKWGDGGFFRVQDADVLGFVFYDVFWTLNDLKQEEIDAYNRVPKTVIQPLLGLQSAKYKCPKCFTVSNMGDFSGDMFKQKCPQCEETFESKNGDLILHMYLSSLLR